MVTSAPLARTLPGALARRFEGIVFDWDGTAVHDRRADASEVRALVEQLCNSGVDIAVVSGTHLGNVDDQLLARPRGPGRLLLALNRGSELFEVDEDGPHLLARREATIEEDAALTRAAEQTIESFARRGLTARIVSQRLNRRKIDLIPLPEWDDPPKSVIDRLVTAVEQRLDDAGIRGLREAAEIALDAAREVGLVDAKVTSDAKHVEIGLTDKADSARAVLAELWADGIASSLVLIGGDEFGPLGGLPGSDSLMLVPEARDAMACSVGIEPNGVPESVVHLPGGPDAFVALLADQLDRRHDVPSLASDPRWSIVVEGFDPLTERARESLLAISDGVIGTTAAPLLSHADERSAVLAAGTFVGHGSESKLLRAPHWARLDRRLRSGDQVTRVLDIYSGVLRERVTGRTRLVAARFVSLARPGTACLRAVVEPADASPALASPPGPLVSGRHDGYHWMAAQGTDASATAVGVQHRDQHRLDRLVAYVTGSGGPRVDEAIAALTEVDRLGFDVLLAEHRREWARRWAKADVAIVGDDELQHSVRVALFHLMAAVGDRGEAAVGARGLTGDAYGGHVFWDADVYVLPFLAATHAPAARAMLEYRIRRLPVAIARARAEGREGARFAWESASTGEEVTPRSGRIRSGQVVPIRTGDAELHIVGDVAWAACCYAEWTGDEEFRSGPGHELLVETARYWASRIRVTPDGSAHILGVIGPDEYHEPVDDDAYTNVLARWNLRTAAESIDRYGAAAMSAERARWLALADALVDGFHPDTQVYEESAGFFNLEPILIADVAPRRPITADLLLGRERVHQAQIVKQADVLMLHHLLPDEVAPGSLGPNLDFYEPRTAHGSSLSPGIHAALFARAGRLREAVDMLAVAAAIDVDDLTQTGAGGVHLGAMGSVWQALAFGFMGVRPRGAVLVIDPKVPAQWDALELRVTFRGTAMCIRANAASVTIVAAAPVAIQLDGEQITCSAGETVFSRREVHDGALRRCD